MYESFSRPFLILNKYWLNDFDKCRLFRWKRWYGLRGMHFRLRAWFGFIVPFHRLLLLFMKHSNLDLPSDTLALPHWLFSKYANIRLLPSLQLHTRINTHYVDIQDRNGSEYLLTHIIVDISFPIGKYSKRVEQCSEWKTS